jgi:hypothetical protein
MVAPECSRGAVKVVKRKRPVVGIIGNSYLMNNSYPCIPAGR